MLTEDGRPQEIALFSRNAESMNASNSAEEASARKALDEAALPI